MTHNQENDMETIFIVDDEPNIIDLARLYLEREGYRVLPRATVGTPST